MVGSRMLKSKVRFYRWIPFVMLLWGGPVCAEIHALIMTISQYQGEIPELKALL